MMAVHEQLLYRLSIRSSYIDRRADCVKLRPRGKLRHLEVDAPDTVEASHSACTTLASIFDTNLAQGIYAA